MAPRTTLLSSALIVVSVAMVLLWVRLQPVVGDGVVATLRESGLMRQQHPAPLRSWESGVALALGKILSFSARDCANATLLTFPKPGERLSYGQKNNCLLQFGNIVGLAARLGSGVVIPECITTFFGEYSDLKRAFDGVACVVPRDEPGLERRIVRMGAHESFYADWENASFCLHPSWITKYRFLVQAAVVLSPVRHLRVKVQDFEASLGSAGGYNAIHLRWLDGWCMERVQSWTSPDPGSSSAINSYIPKELAGGRPTTPADICSMSDDYIQAAASLVGADPRLPWVLAHDRQQPERAREIQVTLNAKVYAGDSDDYVDMLLLLRAKSVIFNPASTFSGNALNMRRVLAPGGGRFPYVGWGVERGGEAVAPRACDVAPGAPGAVV